VINVSWEDAQAFAQWLSDQTGQRYRLPSEAEWEYVAAAGTQTMFWWGSSPGKNQANCFNCGSDWDGEMTAPVDSFAANAFGLKSTAGNVREWVQDCYQPSYSEAPTDGSAVEMPDCAQRVVRGGAYNKPATSMRSTKRSSLSSDTRIPSVGFRLVREP
jgi:formylglycine-generating enzyme required for sulfatase activity